MKVRSGCSKPCISLSRKISTSSKLRFGFLVACSLPSISQAAQPSWIRQESLPMRLHSGLNPHQACHMARSGYGRTRSLTPRGLVANPPWQKLPRCSSSGNILLLRRGSAGMPTWFAKSCEHCERNSQRMVSSPSLLILPQGG